LWWLPCAMALDLPAPTDDERKEPRFETRNGRPE
jgi:hypothetical protein